MGASPWWLTFERIWPQATSTVAREIDQLFFWIAVIVGTWFGITMLALVLFLHCGRKREGRAWQQAAQVRSREAWWIAAGATLVLASDLVIESLGYPVWQKLAAAAPTKRLHVRVEARQFAWIFTYPGADGVLGTEDDVQLQNELHVPVGEPVELQLRSLDVVHSLFLPTMRWKQDVVPGTEVRRWFVATEVGKFPVACAELCGFGHYRMGAELIVHTVGSYRQWMATAHTDKAEAEAPQPW